VKSKKVLRANEKEKTATLNGEVHNANTEEAPRADADQTNRETEAKTTEERQTVFAAISRITALSSGLTADASTSYRSRIRPTITEPALITSDFQRTDSLNTSSASTSKKKK
jgi:hypothetical protein